jgi:hypothetical protein
MPCLATLGDLRRHLGLRADETSDDARLLTALEAASADFERDCGRQFEPRFAALVHPLADASDWLSLRDDLLVPTELADAGGPISLAHVERHPAQGPAALLRLAAGRAFSGAVTVTGWWGWHDDPAALWTPTGQTVRDQPLTTSATRLTVTDSAAFSPGQLLQAEAEVLRVRALDPALQQLVVARGQQGTAAATHAQNTALSAFAPPPDIVDLVLRRTAWLARHAEPLPASLRDAALRWRRERI